MIRTSRSGRLLAGLASTGLILSAFGASPTASADPAGAARTKAPRLAYLDKDYDTRVRAGKVRRTLDGVEPVRWFSDGTLWLRTPDDESGMSVYDPATNKTLKKVGFEWAESPGDGEDWFPRTDQPQARKALFGITEGRGKIRLVEYTNRFKKVARTILPGKPWSDPPKTRTYRTYRSPVRVGRTILIPYTVSKTRSGKPVSDGVVRVRGKKIDQILKGEHIDELIVSSDYRTVFAVKGKRPANDLDTESGNAGPYKLLRLSSRTGKVVTKYGRPPGYKNRWTEVVRADRRGKRVAVQLSVRCNIPRQCKKSDAAWTRANGNWKRLGKETPRTIRLWQSPTKSVNALDKRASFTAPGSLLRPR